MHWTERLYHGRWSFAAMILDDDEFIESYLESNLAIPTTIHADWGRAQAQRDAEIEQDRELDYALALRQVQNPTLAKRRLGESAIR